MAEHGTVAGYREHQRRHRRACPACREAWRLYHLAWRNAHPTPRSLPATPGGLRCAVCNQSLRDHEIGGECYREYLLSQPRGWKGRVA